MHSIPPMVDMRRSADEKSDLSAIPCSPSDYPWGLSISLDNESLKKLDVDFDSVEIGETYHLFVLAKVTSKSRNDSEGNGQCDRIELQITHVAAESEDVENKESDSPLRERMYKKK